MWKWFKSLFKSGPEQNFRIVKQTMGNGKVFYSLQEKTASVHGTWWRELECKPDLEKIQYLRQNSINFRLADTIVSSEIIS